MVEPTKVGIKESKEIILAGFALTRFVREAAKDGLDLSDAGAFALKLANDEAFRTLLVEAAKGADKTIAEAKDLDFSEGIELAMMIKDELAK